MDISVQTAWGTAQRELTQMIQYFQNKVLLDTIDAPSQIDKCT